MGLKKMLKAQEALQSESFGGSPATFNTVRKIQFLKDMVYALEDELHELMDEVGWKPWATSRHIHEDPARSELVDAWHFFMNIMLVLEVTPEMLEEGYFAKRAKNAQRQVDGYDGVEGKCPKCKRALDDSTTICFPALVEDSDGKGREGFCQDWGNYT